jgi:hypothetical protein
MGKRSIRRFDLGVIQILELAGFQPKPRCRFLRHQDRRYPLDELRRNEWFELYQSYQSKPVFHHVDQLVSFYGLSGTRAAFYGVFDVLGEKPASEGPGLADCPWSEEWKLKSQSYYDLKRDKRFDDLRDRLVINWGPGTRSWVQKATNKPILEIQERGRSLPPFDDYLEFSLRYIQLTDLFANEEAHREWRARLSAVGGVYLILAEDTGNQYVGSAYGEGGIWSRWREYAKNGHGGNKKLRDLNPAHFRFSVLQVLSKTMSRDEVRKHEAHYKAKLGSRAKGLNLN